MVLQQMRSKQSRASRTSHTFYTSRDGKFSPRIADMLVAMLAVLVVVGIFLENMQARNQFFASLPQEPSVATRQIIMRKLNQFDRALEELHQHSGSAGQHTSQYATQSKGDAASDQQNLAGLRPSELQFAHDYERFLPDEESPGTITSLRIQSKISNAIPMPLSAFAHSTYSKYIVVAYITTSWQGHYDDGVLSSSMSDVCTFIVQVPTQGMPVLPQIQAFSLFDYAIVEMQQSDELKRRESEPWWMEFFNPIKW